MAAIEGPKGGGEFGGRGEAEGGSREEEEEEELDTRRTTTDFSSVTADSVGVAGAVTCSSASLFFSGDGEEVGKKKPWPCCDMCICTRSNPPQCRCNDVFVGGCHRNCKSCVCTKSIPPYCRCTDVIYEDCGKRCHPEE
ncbi:hypothetical protein B296_00012092 [Ensete ventricosum]|uniref:Bowman-Birk serine protease inhibitors family domain-containing protein n=1 Tax=Ensete ventricosum TaxID=4639 RepID=A0A427ATB5_ENSVE|nr:hypothetical protein B296_00012092 [Ensete ventricosum]